MFKRHRDVGNTPEFWETGFGWHGRIRDLLTRIRLRIGFDPRLRALIPSVNQGDVVVDVGSGRGHWVNLLAKRGCFSLGIDFSHALIESSKSRYADAAWTVGRADRLPLRSQSVDALISWGVIEHYEAGPAKVLLEFRRVLKTGGTLLVTVPADSSRQRRALDRVDRDSTKSRFFEWFFEKDDLSLALQESGFFVRQVRVASRSPHLLLPSFYSWLLQHSRAGLSLLVWLTKPIMRVVPGTHHMLLAVAVRS